MHNLLMLVEGKCKAIKAIYQVRDKALRSLPGCSLPTIRFSGSPDAELNHILEVLIVEGNVAVMIFSAALRYSGDQDSLSREVAALNSESHHGMWVFEPTPSIKQFCYITWVQVDKQIPDKQTADLLWKTILFADSSYKQQARLLMQRAFGTPKLIFSSKKITSLTPALLNNLLSRLEEIYGTVNVAQSQEGVQYSFEGRLKESTIHDDFVRFQGDVALGEVLCSARIVFCEKAVPAVFGSRHHMNSLIDRLNKFNLTLSVGCFQFLSDHGNVCFKYQFPWSGYQGLQLPQTLRNILLSLHSTLVPYFEQVQRFYQTLRVPVEVDESSVEVEKFSAAEFAEEMKEIVRLEMSNCAGHLLKSMYQIYPGTCSIKYVVPAGLQSLAEILQTSTILSQSMLAVLISALRTLRVSKAFYSHLPQIIFVCTETEYIVLVPMTLTRHKADSGVIGELLAAFCTNMIECEQLLAESCTVQEIMEEIDPEELLDSAMLATDPKTQCLRLGQTPVELHYLDSIRTRLEMREILYQLKVLRKSPLSYRAAAYGLVIEDGRLALIIESLSQFPTLRECAKRGNFPVDEIPRLSDSIKAAVEFNNQAGLFPLKLDLDSVRVRGERGKRSPVFPFLQDAKGLIIAEKSEAISDCMMEMMNEFVELASTASSNCSLP